MNSLKPSIFLVGGFCGSEKEYNYNFHYRMGAFSIVEYFNDKKHDIDSCMDVWEGFYKKVYTKFFDKYFDFSEIEDKETNANCKRYYIKLRKDIDISKEFPQFKIAGDCIFNFNNKKVEKFQSWIDQSSEGKNLLKQCMAKHHSFENFAFMPITGGMNNQKGRHPFDRPDTHISEIQKYFKFEENTILNSARRNEEALKWYLSIFEKDIYKYLSEVYLIENRDFIDKEFLPFANKKIESEDSAIQYMNLALKFWSIRKKNIDKYIKNN